MRSVYDAVDFIEQLTATGNVKEADSYFRSLNVTDKKSVLNNERLSFPAFFMLSPALVSLELISALNNRCKTAQKLIEQKWQGPRTPGLFDEVINPDSLKWMLTTGITHDGFSDFYDELMDNAALLLILKFRDTSALSAVQSLIFIRNGKGTFNHDLIWAFFAIFDFDALKEAAEHILSPDGGESEFACHLFGIKPPKDANGKRAVRDAFVASLEENLPYLYPTRDSYQRTSNPEFIKLNKAAKYIGKPVSRKSGRPEGELSAHERALLRSFDNAPESDKELLPKYSKELKDWDYALWKTFIEAPFTAQVTAAKSGKADLV